MHLFSPVVAVRLFEKAESDGNLLVIDYLLALPTLPNQLIDAAYLYVSQGEQNFIKRRILDFVNQRGLVDEFADFMIDQIKTPVNSVWTTAFPAIREQKTISAHFFRSGFTPDSPFDFAFNCAKYITAAFEQRYRDTFSTNHSVICAERLRMNDECDFVDFLRAVYKDQSNNSLVREKSGSWCAFMVSTSSWPDSGVLLLEFTKRSSYDQCFLRFEVGDNHVYHLQFFTFDSLCRPVIDLHRNAVTLSKVHGDDLRNPCADCNTTPYESAAFNNQAAIAVTFSSGKLAVHCADRSSVIGKRIMAHDNYSLVKELTFEMPDKTRPEIRVWSSVYGIEMLHGAFMIQHSSEFN
jgi:hypothetical protein